MSAPATVSARIWESVFSTSAVSVLVIDCTLTGKKYNTASARILTNSIGAYNDFDHPEDVKITDFDALTLENNNLHFNIPACAVMEITVS